MGWFTEHLGTIVVSLVLIAIVALIVGKMIRDKKKGKSSSGCGCANCAMRGSCHSTDKK